MNRPYYEYFGRQSQTVSTVRNAQKCLHKDEYGRCVYYSHNNPVGTLTKHVTDDPYLNHLHLNLNLRFQRLQLLNQLLNHRYLPEDALLTLEQ